MPEIGVVDLFCGAGGLSFGLQNAGLKIKAGVDVDPSAEFPFTENTQSEFVHRDVRHLAPEDVVALYGDSSVRVLAGCAPCQPFSTYSNTRKSADDRWRLLDEFLRLSLEVRPDVITMENVVRLSATDMWKRFVGELTAAGYNVSWDLFSCSDFGVPQSRKRLILLASKLGPVALPAPSKAPPLTVRMAIGNLPSVSAGAANFDDPLHVASRLSKENLQRIRAATPGGTWRDWPAALRAKCHLKETGATYPSVYGRMEWDKVAPTITTQFYGFGNGRFGHPEQDRAITIREAAILQSFPSDYRFIGPDDKATFRRLGTLIGNAVPPKVGEAIGRSIKYHLG